MANRQSTEMMDLGSLENHSAQALGAFLRARRESLDPVRLGLARGGRRRTPGLRREDVAALADIGITWYTKLEQGRATGASSRVLSAIAAALQCNEAETRHLFNLGGIALPADVAKTPLCSRLSESCQMMLDQLDPIPAIVQNARFDILGFNPAYCRLLNVDLERIAREDRNCIYLALVHPDWRASLLDWEDTLPRLVAMFRAAMAEHLHEALWEQQLQRYMAVSPEFRAAWQRYEVHGIENQIKRFRHPRHGVLSLQQTNWWSAPKNGDRLIVYLPVDEESERGLRERAQDGQGGKPGLSHV
jgi:transcriptional regulator with XRE-family HTH domain